MMTKYQCKANLRRQTKPSPTKGGMHVHVNPGSVPGASAHMAFGSHESGSQGSGGEKTTHKVTSRCVRQNYN